MREMSCLALLVAIGQRHGLSAGWMRVHCSHAMPKRYARLEWASQLPLFLPVHYPKLCSSTPALPDSSSSPIVLYQCIKLQLSFSFSFLEGELISLIRSLKFLG
jgi:hypothetical protein